MNVPLEILLYGQSPRPLFAKVQNAATILHGRKVKRKLAVGQAVVVKQAHSRIRA